MFTERNSEKVSPKQNRLRRRNTYVEFSMDMGSSALIIHKYFVNKNNFITRKISTNQWSTMAGSISKAHEAKIKLILLELNAMVHFFAPFHVTTPKFNYDVIFCRELFRELGIQLNFQNKFIGWQDINIHMKLID